MESRVITLTTDFGHRDPFVGIMKGVILKINPRAHLVDLCHEVEPGNVLRAAYILNAAIPFFPPHTIHLVVVDPGVGSDRRKIVVKAGDAFFVAPDNGVLTFPLKNPKLETVVEILDQDLFLQPTSATFHGRDIFAPAAAHLSLGKNIKSYGGKVGDPKVLELPAPEILEEGRMKGAVVYTDWFGNLATNLGLPPEEEIFLWRVRTAADFVAPLHTHYAEAAEGKLAALVNSWGQVELFVKDGSASERFGLKEGEEIFLEKIRI